ncbi:MAG: 16S rRNA (guanine(966)-N(2))-methyltransferase RsmD [Actinomycetota bacterium]
MRVIAGSAKGRRLKAPPGTRVRPTSDRLKEALFSHLGASLEGCRVLDLYAGTGALGIEALSRGAREAVFVERDQRAAAALVSNLEATGLSENAGVRRATVERFADDFAGEPFDFVFLDPPYELGIPAGVIETLLERGAIGALGKVVVESSRRRGPFAPPEGFEIDQVTTYGDSAVVYLSPARESI